MEHTQGKWEVNNAMKNKTLITGEGMGNWIAEIYPRENMEANARLIVKAVNSHPELLEACKWALHAIEILGVAQTDIENAPLVIKLKQAISKAEGGE